MRWKLFALLWLSLMLTGCASTRNPKDPFEGFNRAMFSFNDTLDRNALKPVATGYRKVTPEPVQIGVGNFFSNLADVWTAVNNLLQLKVKDGASDVVRVAINSTVGIAGLIDVGSKLGLPKHKEDFGQTLGHWGVPAGPYLVLPLFGASTVRDTVALPVDFKGDPWAYKYPVRWRNAGSALRLVDTRAAVLDAYDLVEEAALDRYEFVRDAFLQRREDAVRDGEAPTDNGKAAPPADTPPTETAKPPAAVVTPAADPVAKPTDKEEPVVKPEIDAGELALNQTIETK